RTAIKIYRGDLGCVADWRRKLLRIAVDVIIEVAEDPAARAICEDSRKHFRPGVDDQLIPERVEKRFIFLDRTAESDVVIVHVSPRRSDAWHARIVQPHVGIKYGVLDVPRG